MRPLIMVLLLALVVLGPHASPAIQAEKPVVKNGNGDFNKQESEKHTPSKDSTSIAPSPHDNNPTSGAEEKDSQPNPNDRVYRVNVIAQPEPRRDPWFIAYVVFTGISVVIGLAALGLLYRQTSATKIAADAAKRSAEVAESALKLSERADVLLDACSAGGKLPDGKDFRVVLQFKNFGRTRAKEVKLTLHLPIEGVPETSHEFVPAVTMGAGETKNISSQPFIDFLNAETAGAILSQRIPLKFEGGATYKDVFDCPHWVRYTGTYDWGTRCFHIDTQDAD